MAFLRCGALKECTELNSCFVVPGNLPQVPLCKLRRYQVELEIFLHLQWGNVTADSWFLKVPERQMLVLSWPSVKRNIPARAVGRAVLCVYLSSTYPRSHLPSPPIHKNMGVHFSQETYLAALGIFLANQ